MANLRAYAQMVDEAKKLGFPEMYETDLYVIDRAYMEWDHAPRVFGWIIRKLGTHLLLTRQDKATAEYWQKEAGAECYWYDGHNLNHVTSQELLDLLATSPDIPSQVYKRPTQYLVTLNNRIEYLRMLERHRNGNYDGQVCWAQASNYNPHAYDYEHFSWPIIHGLHHSSQYYGPRSEVLVTEEV